MQDELDSAHPELQIDLLVINEIGFDSGLEDLYAVTDLPVLQDDEIALVWDSWAATWRDTWILDTDNASVGVYNLTEHDLSDPDEYALVYEALVSAAGG